MQNLGSMDISQLGAFGDTSDGITIRDHFLKNDRFHLKAIISIGCHKRSFGGDEIFLILQCARESRAVASNLKWRVRR